MISDETTIKKRSKSQSEAGYVPLKVAITLLPASVLHFYFPRHTWTFPLGIGFGIILSQVIPPKLSTLMVIIRIVIAVAIGLAIELVFTNWTW